MLSSLKFQQKEFNVYTISEDNMLVYCRLNFVLGLTLLYMSFYLAKHAIIVHCFENQILFQAFQHQEYKISTKVPFNIIPLTTEN